MLARYVTRGLQAGLVAGVAFGLFVALVGNPLVGLAEGATHHGQAAATHHDGSAVSDAVTRGASVGAGVLWGLLAGVAVFGIAYYFLEPVLPGTPDARSYLLGAVGFVTVSGAPWLVLPPRPAGVEAGLPQDVRLFWYATMMVAGAVVCGLSGYAYTRLRSVRGRSVALVGAALPFGLLAVPALVAPATPVDGSAPAQLTASFRGFVVFGQVGFWFVLATAHAWLLRRERVDADGHDLTARTDPNPASGN